MAYRDRTAVDFAKLNAGSRDFDTPRFVEATPSTVLTLAVLLHAIALEVPPTRIS
jgi:hypothetical protein